MRLPGRVVPESATRVSVGERTGYVICSIDLAAAASSPHMMSFTMMPPSRSSDRRIGRPTMEGYWWSGKFCEGFQKGIVQVIILSTHCSSIANLEKACASIEH